MPASPARSDAGALSGQSPYEACQPQRYMTNSPTSPTPPPPLQPEASAAPRKKFSSLFWALLESGVLSILSLVTLLILARLVGPKDLGLFALAFGLVQFLTMVVEMLMHDALVQRPELRPLDIDTAFWTSAVTGFLLFGVSLAIAEPFAQLFNEPQLEAVVMVTACGIIFSSIGSVPIALLRRQGGFRALAIRSFYGRAIAAVVGIGLAITGAGVWSVVTQQVVMVAVSTVLLWPATHWRPRLRFSWHRLGRLLAFGVFAVGSRMIWLASLRLFTIWFGYNFGVVAAGYLNIAQRVVDTLYDMLGGAAYNVALPFLSRQQKNKEAFYKSCRDATELAAVSTLPIFGGLAICAPMVVGLLLGEAWDPAADYIRIFAIASMVQFLFLMPNVALVAAGRPGSVFAVSCASFVIVFGSLFLLGPATPFDAAVIWVSRAVLAAPVMAFFVYRLFNGAAKGLVSGVVVPLAAVSLMAFALMLLHHYGLREFSDLAALAVLVPSGAAIYVLTIALFGRGLLRRIADPVFGQLAALRGS